MKTRSKNKRMKIKTNQVRSIPYTYQSSIGGDINPIPGTSRDDPGQKSSVVTGDLNPDSNQSWTEDGELHVFTFKDCQLGKSCLKGFNNLYQSKQLCDVKIRVENEVFDCHKSHLAASSQYFLTMFTAGLSEQHKDEITINMIPVASMRSIIHYIYSGCCDLDMVNVQDILFAADYFQLLDLKSGCEDYMIKHLDSSNLLRAYFLAQKLNCTYLEQEAGSQLAEDIVEVMKTNEFLTLLPDQLSDLLRYHDNEATEEELFLGALKWLDHDPEQRKDHIYDVFCKIRFVHISNFFLFDKVMNNSLLTADVRLKRLLDEVIKYSMMKERWPEFDFILRPRTCEDWDRCIIYTRTHGKKSSLTAFGNYPNADLLHLSDLRLAMLPQNISNSLIVGFGENLYIAGGNDLRDVKTSDKLFKWMDKRNDFEMPTMESLSSMNKSRDHFSFVQVDQHLYAIGGRNMAPDMTASILSHVEYYDPAYDMWNVVRPMPRPLRNTCAVAFQGKLYVFGGEMGKSDSPGKTKQLKKKHYYVSQNVLCYDPSKDTWTSLPDMKYARGWAGCAILEKKIYVIGGGQGDEIVAGVSSKQSICPLKVVEIYDPVANTWEDGPDLPVPLYGAGVVKYNDSIFVLGGCYQNEVSCSVYQLHAHSDTWIQRHDLDWMNSNCIKPYVVPRCSFTVLDMAKSYRQEDGNAHRRRPKNRQSQSPGSSPSWYLRRWSRSPSRSQGTPDSMRFPLGRPQSISPQYSPTYDLNFHGHNLV